MFLAFWQVEEKAGEVRTVHRFTFHICLFICLFIFLTPSRPQQFVNMTGIETAHPVLGQNFHNPFKDERVWAEKD